MHRRGQSVSEYVLLAALVAASLTTMAVYLQRSAQAKLRWHTDLMLGFAGSEGTQRYGIRDTGETVADFTVDTSSQETGRRAAVAGVAAYTVTGQDATVRSGSQQFIQLQGPPAEEN